MLFDGDSYETDVFSKIDGFEKPRDFTVTDTIADRFNVFGFTHLRR